MLTHSKLYSSLAICISFFWKIPRSLITNIDTIHKTNKYDALCCCSSGNRTRDIPTRQRLLYLVSHSADFSVMYTVVSGRSYFRNVKKVFSGPQTKSISKCYGRMALSLVYQKFLSLVFDQ